MFPREALISCVPDPDASFSGDITLARTGRCILEGFADKCRAALNDSHCNQEQIILVTLTLSSCLIIIMKSDFGLIMDMRLWGWPESE